MRVIFILLFVFPIAVPAQTDSILSGVYNWKVPPKQSSKSISSAILFQGKAFDLQWLQVSANQLKAVKTKIDIQVPTDEEQLLIVKSGRISLELNESTHTVGAGTVALLIPGQKYALETQKNEACTYYLMRYRSKHEKVLESANTAGGSLITDLDKIAFKPHDKGGRRDLLERPTAMFRRLEIHETTLKQGLKSHEPHTHKAEEIVLVTDGRTEMEIAGKLYPGGTGSIYYLGSNVPHALKNNGNTNCVYFAIQFE
ncbi:cupin domain-containing protein [Segetibacter sp. 3557_3]|uniref:cupin domain-containing protein n=1 Tax=Segetibacter sp. 3557_3 TaxID=2547429 RepID=UPI0014054307|nr:cupin domain-containing protein [Segetibacter sp. 3557_3]